MRFCILAMMNPFLRDEEGQIYLDRRWEWDLNFQLGQIDEIHIFIPEGKEGAIADPKSNIQKNIVIHSMGRFDWRSGLIRSWLEAASTINNEISSHDLVQTTCDVFSLSFFIYLSMKRHKNLMIILDGDNVQYARFKAENSKFLVDRIKWNVFRFLIDRMIRYALTKSKIAFVVGDELFEKYGHNADSRVMKINACWIARKDIITEDLLNVKVEGFKNRSNISICYASSLTPTKNPMMLIEIARILREKGIDFVIDILGEGEQKQNVEKAVVEYDLTENVRFCGYVEYGKKFFEFLRKHDIILVPNRGGEQPRVIFDAFANGCVVIGSRIRAFSIIQDGKTGLLCDPMNSKEFAEAIIRMRRGSTLESIANNARQFVSSQTIENQMEKRFSSIRNEFNISSKTENVR